MTKKRNSAIAAYLVIATCAWIATAAIAITQWPDDLKVLAIATVIILGAFLAAVAADIERDKA